jgi:hypothetical protein
VPSTPARLPIQRMNVQVNNRKPAASRNAEQRLREKG